MKISTIDNNSWYTLEVEKCDWMNHSKDETEPSISFELNNLHEVPTSALCRILIGVSCRGLYRLVILSYGDGCG